MTTVFVYGTLTDAETARAVLPDATDAGPATLVGLHRVDGRYPTLSPGGEVAGRLLRTDHVDVLDDYEGVDRGLYVRVWVPLGDGDGTVATYVGDPDLLDVAVSWPADEPFPASVRSYARENDVRVEYES